MKNLLSTLIAILAGLVVLAGFFLKVPILVEIRTILLEWAVIVAAMALFVGVINMIRVNNAQLSSGQNSHFYNLVLMITLVLTFGLGLFFKTGHPIMNFIFYSFQMPIEKTLMALLAVTLLLASIRLLQKRLNLFSIIFLVVTLLVLLGTAPLPFGELPFISRILRPFITQVLAGAGARGILLGIALATITTGLRILLAADRPYGGK
jgi:hypothetical protein